MFAVSDIFIQYEPREIVITDVIDYHKFVMVKIQGMAIDAIYVKSLYFSASICARS